MTDDTALQEHADTGTSAGVFSKEMLTELGRREKAVRTALNSIDRNMEKIALNLYWIYSNKAYRTMGFESITDYALKTFDLGKSTTYNFISLAERFAAHSEDGSIIDKFDDRYKDYSLSKLSLLTGLTDKQIEESGITPDMSVRDIKNLVKKTQDDNTGRGLIEELDTVIDLYRLELNKKQDGQGTMAVKDNELSVSSMPGPDNESDDDGIFGYAADTVYEFSIQDDERSVLKEIKSVLKKNRMEHEDASWSLILRYPVRKG